MQRISRAGADAANVEKLTVLAQPHRRGGDLDQRWESTLGRLTLRHKLSREYYDAGLEFGSMCRFYHHALGCQRYVNEGHNGGGMGVSAQKTRWLAAEVDRLETALQKLNPIGFAAVRALAIFEKEIDQRDEPAAIVVLLELGVLLRKVGGRAAPMQHWRTFA